MSGEHVEYVVDDSRSNASTVGSSWKDFRRWKTPNQLCMICLLPFVLIFVGCLLLGLVWSGKVEPSRQVVLTCGMVSFFSGFLMCVIANFCDACGVTCKRYDQPADSETQNQTMFVDLGDLGPDTVEREDNGENNCSEIQTTLLEMETNANDREDSKLRPQEHRGN